MKPVKILGLLTVAAAGLMAFSASASATQFTSPTGQFYTGEIQGATHAGHSVTHTADLGTIECASSFAGNIQAHGTGVTANVVLKALSFSGCTNSWHKTVVNPGTLEIHYTAAGTAQVTSSGMTVTATRFGVTCTKITNNTTLGHLTDSHKTGGHATLHIDATLPYHSGSSFLCGTGFGAWTASYTIVSPGSLYVDH